MLSLGPRRFGDYELLEEVARGGMGVVYRARQASLGRIVALKMVLAGPFASPEAIGRLRAEAQAAASLQHPGIVAIHEVSECDGQPFFTMDLIEGHNLATLLRDGPLPPARAARYGAQVAEAIEHAHRRGVLHRDLKPSNVLVDAMDRVHVTDFGLAKRLADEGALTVTGQTLGSPGYMAPEQASDKHGEVSVRTDVYALGALLYDLVTGRPPFASGTVAETLQQLLRDEPLSPRALNPSVPVDLETICLRCLEKEPPRRYASAQELADELGRFLRDEPTMARPLSPTERFARWCRRNPAIALLEMLVVTLLLVVAVGGLLAAWRIDASRRSERDQSDRVRDANARLEHANVNLARTVNVLEAQRAEEFFRDGQVDLGLIHLASLVRRDPGNSAAAERLLSALIHRDLATPAAPPLPHPDKVTRVEYSPDGTSLLTACADGNARLWNIASREPRLILRHGSALWCATFSPDAGHVATGAANGTVKVWETRSGQAAMATLLHGGVLRCVAFSPDGAWLASAGDDRTVKLWSLRSGELRFTIAAHADRAYAVVFTPDGKRLVSAAADGIVRAWSAEDGHSLGVITTHAHWAMAIAISPDGQGLATASRDKTIQQLALPSGAPLRQPLVFPDGLNALNYSPDGRLLATGCIDYGARITDVRSGKSLSQPLHHDEQVESVAFSPDGMTLATAAQDGYVQFWEVRPGRALAEPLRHLDAVRWLQFSRDGRRLVSAGWDNTARVWDALTGQAAAPPLRQHAHIQSANFSPDDKQVVTASADGTARLWDVETGRLAGPPLQHAAGLWAAVFSPNGRLVATASADKTARLWDAATGRATTPGLVHEGAVFGAWFSPDSRWLLTVSDDHTARLWDARSGQAIAPPLRHTDSVIWADFSPDGSRVATASRDNTARIWNALSGAPVTPALEHGRTVETVQFSPNGRWVVTASIDHTARVWDAATGQPVGRRLQHGDQIWHAVFSPDSLRVATGAADGAVRIWDAESGLPVSELLQQSAGVRQLRFSPDGKWLAAACVAPGNSVRIWPVPRSAGLAPTALPALAEAVAGTSLGPEDQLRNVSSARLQDLQRELAPAGPSNSFTPIAQWFFADRGDRPVAPGAVTSVAEYAAARVLEGTPAALEEALRLQPTNAVVLARLARVALTKPGADQERRAEARMLAERALRFDSTQAEALEVLAATSQAETPDR